MTNLFDWMMAHPWMSFILAIVLLVGIIEVLESLVKRPHCPACHNRRKE